MQGLWRGKRGPVDGIAADPCYLDVFVPAGLRKALPVDEAKAMIERQLRDGRV